MPRPYFGVPFGPPTFIPVPMYSYYGYGHHHCYERYVVVHHYHTQTHHHYHNNTTTGAAQQGGGDAVLVGLSEVIVKNTTANETATGSPEGSFNPNMSVCFDQDSGNYTLDSSGANTTCYETDVVTYALASAVASAGTNTTICIDGELMNIVLKSNGTDYRKYLTPPPDLEPPTTTTLPPPPAEPGAAPPEPPPVAPEGTTTTTPAPTTGAPGEEDLGIQCFDPDTIAIILNQMMSPEDKPQALLQEAPTTLRPKYHVLDLF